MIGPALNSMSTRPSLGSLRGGVRSSTCLTAYDPVSVCVVWRIAPGKKSFNKQSIETTSRSERTRVVLQRVRHCLGGTVLVINYGLGGARSMETDEMNVVVFWLFVKE